MASSAVSLLLSDRFLAGFPSQTSSSARSTNLHFGEQPRRAGAVP